MSAKVQLHVFDSEIAPYRWGDQTVILLDPRTAALVLRLPGDPDWLELSPGPAGVLAQMMTADAAWRDEASLGELVCWAMRRSPVEAERLFDDDGATVSWLRGHDWQRIGGVSFDRGLVLEALRHWIQTGAHDDSVHMAVIAHPMQPDVRLLRLQLGASHILVASASTEAVGGDPWHEEED